MAGPGALPYPAVTVVNLVQVNSCPLTHGCALDQLRVLLQHLHRVPLVVVPLQSLRGLQSLALH